MDLMHNVTFRILVEPYEGIYRIVLDEIQIGKTAVVRLDPPAEPEISKGGRKRLEKTRKPRKKSSPALVGEIIWMDRAELNALKDGEEIIPIEIEQENRTLSAADEADYENRKKRMAPFLDFDHFREQVLIHRGIGGLAQEVMEQGCSKSFVYSNFSLLCRSTASSTWSSHALLYLTNSGQIPLLFSGTPDGIGALTKRLSTLQRINTCGYHAFEPFSNPMAAEFKGTFLGTLGAHQYVKNRIVVDDALASVIIELTAGIQRLIVALWIAAHRVAFERKSDDLRLDDFRKAANTWLAPLAPAVAALRTKSPDAMARYEDLIQRDTTFWAKFWQGVVTM